MLSLLLPFGIGLTLLGLAGLGYFIFAVVKARKSGGSDDQVKATLQRLVAVNLGSVCIAGLGLMLVIVGLTLN